MQAQACVWSTGDLTVLWLTAILMAEPYIIFLLLLLNLL